MEKKVFNEEKAEKLIDELMEELEIVYNINFFFSPLDKETDSHERWEQHREEFEKAHPGCSILDEPPISVWKDFCSYHEEKVNALRNKQVADRVMDAFGGDFDAFQKMLVERLEEHLASEISEYYVYERLGVHGEDKELDNFMDGVKSELSKITA